MAIALPSLRVRRHRAEDSRHRPADIHAPRLGRLVGAVASTPLITLGIAAIVTAGALWAALQLEVTFDVKDFFSPDSDFVVALDKTAEYLGDQGGEPAAGRRRSDPPSASLPGRSRRERRAEQSP